ncbi:unnamed protein product [Mytilus edulis]|uniref:MACPF domain-containing protein n=1 Tax=Mytilus edulis TaxID=6550 RepID=A0A8S3S182_MYTED|nr:unnamed protein product [Mytilus edulis]
MSKNQLSSLAIKVIIGLLLVGFACLALMSTLRFNQLSENPKHQEFIVNRDTKRTSRSQVTDIQKGQAYENLTLNLHVETTEKPTVTAVEKNIQTEKASNLNINVDYNQDRQTSDCRYNIPNGVVVVPDVSCVTSFSSTTIQNKYELSKALAVSASANAGGYGASFSASAGYKESSSELESGEVVKILSTAKCNSYFSKLLEDNIPRFTESFITWINRLNNSESNAIYIDFYNRYGTHYLTYTTFGARFTYEHTMKSKDFQTKQEQGLNVAVQASYSGIYSVGAGFNMDSSQKEAASEFSKSVTTETITVGAPPPANGDTMTWASTVKESPVPMGYKLRSIIDLFTDEYMKTLMLTTNILQKN